MEDYLNSPNSKLNLVMTKLGTKNVITHHSQSPKKFSVIVIDLKNKYGKVKFISITYF